MKKTLTSIILLLSLNLFSQDYKIVKHLNSQIKRDNTEINLGKYTFPIIKEKEKLTFDFTNHYDSIPTQIKYLENITEGNYLLAIDKSQQILTVYKKTENDWEEIKSYLTSTGMNKGDKKKSGDHKTPEGIFKIKSIHKSHNWLYEGEKAYGPYFLRLDGKWREIGIHGTNEPYLLGENVSHGCIRLNNKDLLEIKNNYVNLETQILVEDELSYSKNLNLYNKKPFDNFEKYSLKNIKLNNPLFIYKIFRILDKNFRKNLD